MKKVFFGIFFGLMVGFCVPNCVAAAPSGLPEKNSAVQNVHNERKGKKLGCEPEMWQLACHRACNIKKQYRQIFYDDMSPSLVSLYSANLLKAIPKKLSEAIAHKDLGEVIEALHAGADPNIIDSESYAPLHVAAKLNLVRIAAELIKHGADVNKLDGNYGSPLEVAVESGSVAVARLLLHHGARLKTWRYNIAPDMLKKPGMADMLKSLIEYPRRLALCGGLHPRLNAQSPLRDFDQEIIKHIAQYTNIELYVDIEKANPSLCQILYQTGCLKRISLISLVILADAVFSGIICYYCCPSPDPTDVLRPFFYNF